MKNIISLTTAILLTVNLIAQNVGIGTSSPDASAQLDISSNSKGLLIPRMLESQRTGIPAPANGLMVYQTDGSAGFYFYNGSIWNLIGSGGGSSKWTLNGNNIYNNNTENIGIGFTEPANKLSLSGSLLVTEPMYTTSAPPSTGASQTKTMQNGATTNYLASDSTGRFYDPGGPAGNYVNSQNSSMNIPAAAVNNAIEMIIESISLAVGDSLIVKESSLSTAKTLLALGNNYNTAGRWVFNSEGIFVTFKSNADGLNDAGFSILFRRMYTISATKPFVTDITGNTFLFDVRNGALRSGRLSNSVKAFSSIALGDYNNATGLQTVALGTSNTASQSYSLAIGNNNTASGFYATALGHTTEASGNYAISMGANSLANGVYSTTMGFGTQALASYSTASGFNTTANGSYSFAAGNATQTSGNNSAAFGSSTLASGISSFVIGQNSIATNTASFAAGQSTGATGINAASFGNFTNANGRNGFTTGYKTLASVTNSAAFGDSTRATGVGAIATGYHTVASGDYSFVQGFFNTASGNYSAVFGDGSLASGDNSFAAGENNIVSGRACIALGITNTANDGGAFLEGGAIALGAGNTATEVGAIAAGVDNAAAGEGSIALGSENTVVYGTGSVAIGYQNNSGVPIGPTNNFGTIAIGSNLTANAPRAMAFGYKASTNNQEGALVIGDGEIGSATLNAVAPNTFRARFDGGYRFFTSRDCLNAESCQLPAGGNAWVTASDSRLKEKVTIADGEDFLQKISRMKLGSWNYISQNPLKQRHYGPMAQDFYSAFGNDKFGTIGNDTTINSADFDGVNLIAIQALEKRTQKIEQLEKENEELKKMMMQLRKEMDELKATKNH